jgi:hypothetical protein
LAISASLSTNVSTPIRLVISWHRDSYDDNTQYSRWPGATGQQRKHTLEKLLFASLL